MALRSKSAAIRPSNWVPRSPRYVAGIQPEGRGILARPQRRLAVDERSAEPDFSLLARFSRPCRRLLPVYAGAVPAALVTGAGRGLGLEIARALAARGLTVHVTDVDEGAAAAAAERDRRAGVLVGARRPRPRRLRGRGRDDPVERAGSLDVWVNNAGVLVTGHVWDHDPDTCRLLFEVNTLGTINGTLAALGPMRQARSRARDQHRLARRARRATRRGALRGDQARGARLQPRHARATCAARGSRTSTSRAVCPDGILTPMIADKLDDPDAAPSFSGHLMRGRGRRAPCGGPSGPTAARARGAALARLAGSDTRRFPRALPAPRAALHGRRPPPAAPLEEANRGGEGALRKRV